MDIPYHKPQIYAMNILKSLDIDRTFDRNFEKNYDFLRFLEFIQNHSRIIQGSFPELQGIKIHDKTPIQATLGLPEKNQNFDLKPIILMSFGTHFSDFSHADACVACGGPRG